MELMFFLLISVSLSVKAYNFETLTNQIALEYKNPGGIQNLVSRYFLE
jgi:hypothetical protein